MSSLFTYRNPNALVHKIWGPHPVTVSHLNRKFSGRGLLASYQDAET